MSRMFSVSDIQSLCKEVKKGKYKGDAADLDGYKAYLGKLYYKELLSAEAVKAQYDKLQLTFTAGDAQKKEELTPRIALLKSALEALQSGGIDIDGQDKKSELKALTAVSLVMIKNNPRYSGLSAEAQVLKLDENAFYAFTFDEIMAACGTDNSSSITYDAEFIVDLCKLFAKNDAAYMSVISNITDLAGAYDATEQYYSRVKAKLSEYRERERVKRRQNQTNDDELLNEIETKLFARMDSGRDQRLKLSMLLAVYNPECVAYLCKNRDVKSLDKVTIEDGASFVRALEGSARYGMTARIIKSIAPYVNVEIKTGSSEAQEHSADIAEIIAQREEAKKQAAESQKAEDLKILKDALPHFENAEAYKSEAEKYSYYAPQKAEFGCGTFIVAVVVGGGAGIAALLTLAKMGDEFGPDSIPYKLMRAMMSISYDETESLKAILIIFIVIGIAIVLMILASKVDKQNKQIKETQKNRDEMRANAQVEALHEFNIGTKKVENILPENMRKADTIKELINILEYNRAGSLGEAMNIVYTKKNLY